MDRNTNVERISTRGSKMTSIETIRKYWDNRPCNIKHSDAPLGTKEYFDQVEARRYTVEPHNYQFAEFDRYKGKRVLEIGCGIGTDAVNFARAGAEYTGIELSSVSLELAKQRFQIYNLDGRLLLGNAEELEELVAGEQFDLIYSYGVIHHSSKPKNIIKQLPKYLKFSGEIKIMLYATHSWKNYLIERELAQPEAQANCPQAVTYTKQQVREMFKEFDIDITQTFIFPYQIEAYKRKEYVKEPWFEAMPEQMFDILQSKLGWNLLIKGNHKGLRTTLR